MTKLLTAALLATVGTLAAANPLPINLILLMPADAAQEKLFADKLRKVPYFARASYEASGSNITFIASVARIPTVTGAAASATTGLLAASSLGLIPTVENQDVSVHYELRANGVVLANFDYAKNFTSVSNVFGEYGKLPDEARLWVNSTIDQLARDVAANKKLAALQAEYASYFPRRK